MLRHSSTYDRTSQTFEEVPLDSLTEPDMSYTIKELLMRFGVGNTPPISREVYYDEQSDEDASLDGISPTEAPDFDISDAFSLQRTLQENAERHRRNREAFRKSSDTRMTNNATTINDDATKSTEASDITSSPSA